MIPLLLGISDGVFHDAMSSILLPAITWPHIGHKIHICGNCLFNILDFY